MSSLTYENQGVECPFCGDIAGDCWDWVKEDPSQHECGNCGRLYRCYAEYDVTYYAEPVEGPPTEGFAGETGYGH